MMGESEEEEEGTDFMDEGEDGGEEEDSDGDEGEEDNKEEEEEDVPEALERDAKNKKLTAAGWYTAATKLDNGALCLVCKKVFTTKDSSPSNITKHVKNRHKGSEECKKLLVLEAKQKAEKEKKKIPKPKLTMADFVIGKKKISKRDAKEISNALEDFIVATNTSLAMVQNPHFRKFVFILNPGYVAPTRTAITNHIDQKIKDVKVALAKEISEDIREHKTINVTSDGGPSHDVNKTKKNTVTVSRIDSKWNMKTDTLALRVAEGPQTAKVLRTVMREVLDEYGREEEWVTNMTTDNASAPKSSRAPGRHQAVGLLIKYDSPCIDHQFHLLVSFLIESLNFEINYLFSLRSLSSR